MRAVVLAWIVLWFGIVNCYQSPTEFPIHHTEILPSFYIPPNATDREYSLVYLNTAARLIVDTINAKTCNFPDILPNTKLILNTLPNFGLPSIVIQQMMGLSSEQQTFINGFVAPEAAIAGAEVGTVYNVAQLSSFAPGTYLADKQKYPYFSRTAIATDDIVSVTLEALHSFSERGGPGWTDVAVLTDSEGYSIDFAESIIKQCEQTEINILQYRSFLVGSQEFGLDLNEIKESGARVIICIVTEDFEMVLEQANELGLVGENYVWIIAPTTAVTSFETPNPLGRGVLFASDYYGDSHYRECFSEHWANADPEVYPLAGNGNYPPLIAFVPFDMFLATAIAVDTLDKMEMLDGRYIHPQLWSDVIRNISTAGIGGNISFNEKGNRQGTISLQYYDPEINYYVYVATKEPGEPMNFFGDVVWFSNTTELPDLDIRPSFHYWSCEDREKGFDKTGKTVVLHTPDSSNVDTIDIDYHCDTFIDCQNFSDESNDCGSNYTVIFIVFGIITGFLLLVVIILIIFVVIYGVLLNFRRLRVASPFFLIILLLSIFVGLASNFAFFGKAHPVSCGFQPWLLGLPTISMIAVLAAKNFRIYRIFRFPLKRVKISDWELLILWLIVMIPGVIILIIWSSVSIPTAKLKEFDDVDHYVCVIGTSGFVFFLVFVVYSALVLIFGAIISVVSRNVPTLYNESQLLTISIYNLGFLSAVIIPVFFVLNSFNPFLAWILRTCAVLYAFSATMFLQFFPRIFGIFIVDKGRNKLAGMITGSSVSRGSIFSTEL